MNLAGFCSADAKDCGTIAPQSGASAASNSPYAKQASNLSNAVTGALYRMAAAVGKEVLCPTLPIVGAVMAEAVSLYFLPEELITLGPATIATNVLAAEIGKSAGKNLQLQLCG